MPSTKLARYWLAPYMRNFNSRSGFLVNYIVTSQDRPYPVHAYENKGYSSMTQIIQQDEVKRKFSNANKPPSCKIIYQTLQARIDSNFAGETKWRSFGMPAIYWQNTWLAFKNNKKLKNFWKFRHLVLHEEDKINEASRNTRNAKPCLYCQISFPSINRQTDIPKHTHMHVFLQCPLARKLWLKLFPLMRKIESTISFTNQESWILGMRGTNKTTNLLNTIIVSAICTLWKARCELKYTLQTARVPTTSTTLSSIVKAEFKTILNQHFHLHKRNHSIQELKTKIQLNSVCRVNDYNTNLECLF